jgi:hypothetical protein
MVIQHSHLIDYVLETITNHSIMYMEVIIEEGSKTYTNTPTKVLDNKDPMTTPSRNTLGPQSFQWALAHKLIASKWPALQNLMVDGSLSPLMASHR